MKVIELTTILDFLVFIHKINLLIQTLKYRYQRLQREKWFLYLCVPDSACTQVHLYSMPIISIVYFSFFGFHHKVSISAKIVQNLICSWRTYLYTYSRFILSNTRTKNRICRTKNHFPVSLMLWIHHCAKPFCMLHRYQQLCIVSIPRSLKINILYKHIFIII